MNSKQSELIRFTLTRLHINIYLVICSHNMPPPIPFGIDCKKPILPGDGSSKLPVALLTTRNMSRK
jgi:hypothetical protein